MIKESEIRSNQVLKNYQRLVDIDSKRLLKKKRFFKSINLKRIGLGKMSQAFKKKGYNYLECQNTGTLIVNPRPSRTDLFNFYKDSKSNDFWYNNFFLPKLKQRINFTIKPKVNYLTNNFKSYHNKRIIDIGCGSGDFLVNLKKRWKKSKLFGLEPSETMSKKFKDNDIKIFNNVIEKFKVNKKFDVVTCFELFEHVHDPHIFIKSLNNILSRGGLIYLSTLNIDGFDIKYLRENSNSIYPPYHLNFFSIKAMKKLLSLNGFNKIKIITPGKLDFDIVNKNLTYIKDPVFKKILSILNKKKLSLSELKDIQKVIQFNNVSSHMLIMAKKNNEAI